MLILFQDCVNKLLNIQSKLRNYVIIKPGRELIMEGELYKLSRKRMHIRYFILVTFIIYTVYTEFICVYVCIRVPQKNSNLRENHNILQIIFFLYWYKFEELKIIIKIRSMSFKIRQNNKKKHLTIIMDEFAIF